MYKYRMINEFFSGIKYFFKGLGLITSPGLKRFVLFPAIISFTILALVLGFAFYQFDDLLAWLLPNESVLSDWPKWIEWLAKIVLNALRILLYALFAILSLIATSFSYTILANLIASPFNGRLSEKTEDIYYGEKPIIDTESSIFKEILPAIFHEIRKILYFLKLLIPLVILSVIPVINVIAAPLWFAFGAWVLAVEYCDFPAGNHKISFKELKAKLANKRALSLGFGASASVFTMIPILNFFVMPAAVIGATLLWKENHQVINNIETDTKKHTAAIENNTDEATNVVERTRDL
ncbi:MAG: sulfate transporter CysZ [Gammaproteobacteria bacterium]|nr:MAG: sulfate transporter CysZ [Gammaproteobacteria bacterium]